MDKKNIKLEISYKGTSYAGFQRQNDRPTIQQILEEALSKNLREQIKIIGSGRTDAGVHAICQIVNFKTSTNLDIGSLARLVNYDLPEDIKILRAQQVDYNFHSRYWASSRTYQYNIYQSSQPSGFYNDISWHIYQSLDKELMERAADHLVGLHDFRAFSSKQDYRKSTIRRIHHIDIRWDLPHIQIHIKGTSFLRNMVRIIVGTMVDIGRGKRKLASIEEGLKTGQRQELGQTAPAKGLILMEVNYDHTETQIYNI